jgi:hypothetical protein
VECRDAASQLASSDGRDFDFCRGMLMALVYILPSSDTATALGATDNGLFSIDSNSGVISRAGILAAGTAYNVAYLVYDTTSGVIVGQRDTITATAGSVPAYVPANSLAFYDFQNDRGMRMAHRFRAVRQPSRFPAHLSAMISQQRCCLLRTSLVGLRRAC